MRPGLTAYALLLLCAAVLTACSSGDSDTAELGENETADERADNPEHDVEQAAGPLPVDDLAGDKAGDKS